MAEADASHHVGQLDDLGACDHRIVSAATRHDALGRSRQRRQAEAARVARQIGGTLGGLFQLAGVLGVLDRVDALPEPGHESVEADERFVVEEERADRRAACGFHAASIGLRTRLLNRATLAAQDDAL